MSAIASFTLVPFSAATLDAEAARAPSNFQEFVRKHGRDAASFRWSGWVIGALLAYLSEKRGIALEEAIDTRLTDAAGATTIILTANHKHELLDRLRVEDYDEAELETYYNEFNDNDEPGLGKAMLDGIRCLHQSLAVIDETNSVVVQIG